VKEQTTENKTAAVAGAGTARLFPKQAGETPDRWSWVERSVWTERMLNRLAESQEQTVWFETQGFYSLEKAQAKWIQSQTGHH
jgi:hypothetical protein